MTAKEQQGGRVVDGPAEAVARPREGDHASKKPSSSCIARKYRSR
eukprot:CAMPEP_0196699636 /NCGR_PEP_ID=MMETSP1090-20130531/47503_1 /TAXON_ID=37098 /ORGANISM="Isochrysis sp, Strain CCMP1244" /LENGTH=44 /DNA_ID= /DNA_START= /DNA_END= /DNA_ORIENTATION=